MTDKGFSTSVEQILAELARLDLHLYVQTWRVRMQQPDDNALLAHYIPDDEVDRRLSLPPGRPIWADVTLPDSFAQEIHNAMATMSCQIKEGCLAAKERGVPLRLEMLTAQFDLQPVDQDILLLTLAPELDSGYLRLFAYLQDDHSQSCLTVGLALNLLATTIEERLAIQQRLSPSAPLLKHHLVSLQPPLPGRHPSTLEQTLLLDDRIRRYLFEEDGLDQTLDSVLSFVTPAQYDGSIPSGEYLGQMLTLIERNEPLGFYLQGRHGVGRLQTAVTLAARLGQRLLVVDCLALVEEKTEYPAQLSRILRERRLQDALIYWQGFDALFLPEHRKSFELAAALIGDDPAIHLLSGSARWPTQGLIKMPHILTLSISMPDGRQRQQLWRHALNGRAAHLDIETLATRYQLSGSQIHQALQTANNLALWRDPNGQIEKGDILKASRLHASQILSQLAKQIVPTYRWDDLVLPKAQLDQLKQMCHHVQHQATVFETWGFSQKVTLGRGINALFTGQPGTGKTMAADIMAGELGLDLYKIDLAAVVSKFIGETEKNLAQIFEEAEASSAILFFDEADALFGKRTEVKDAHDRYANLEVSYLLQKMDEYKGIVILATNLRDNLDDAFVRRIRFIIDFPLPTAVDRLRIWQGIWPSAAPLDGDVRLPKLAEQLDISGGLIRNIALAAAFETAAGGHRTITMAHLNQAAAAEYQKIGRLLPHGFDA